MVNEEKLLYINIVCEYNNDDEYIDLLVDKIDDVLVEMCDSHFLSSSLKDPDSKGG